MLSDLQKRKLWEFLRGDANMTAFQSWLYNDETLETALGSKTYLDLIGCDFASKEDTFSIKASLRSILAGQEDCHCASLRNLDAIEMGGDGVLEEFLARMTKVARPQTDQWWLHIFRCDICGTNWLVASEERINDMYYVQRISDQAVENAKAGQWPAQFRTYADVLDAGVKLGVAPAGFVDPMSGALLVTVRDLLDADPAISAQDIAKKLGIDVQHATALIREVSKNRADPTRPPPG